MGRTSGQEMAERARTYRVERHLYSASSYRCNCRTEVHLDKKWTQMGLYRLDLLGWLASYLVLEGSQWVLVTTDLLDL